MIQKRNLRASRNSTLDLLADRLDLELRKILKRPSDVEAVHDARVAGRRLLAAGELWASHVAPWVGVRDRLPGLVKRLGRIRNLDIAVELLATGPKEEEAAREEFTRHLLKRRKKERSRIATWLTLKKVDRLRSVLKEVVRELQRRKSK